MGKASGRKREQREAPPLPARFDFGAHFLVNSTAQTASHALAFNQARKEPCPGCGGRVVYQYGNWHCGGYRSGCGWTTARDVRGPNGGMLTMENCPECGGAIVYNGNYFCEHWGDTCGWALPCDAEGTRAEQALSLRLTGEPIEPIDEEL